MVYHIVVEIILILPVTILDVAKADAARRMDLIVAVHYSEHSSVCCFFSYLVYSYIVHSWYAPFMRANLHKFVLQRFNHK